MPERGNENHAEGCPNAKQERLKEPRWLTKAPPEVQLAIYLFVYIPLAVLRFFMTGAMPFALLAVGFALASHHLSEQGKEALAAAFIVGSVLWPLVGYVYLIHQRLESFSAGIVPISRVDLFEGSQPDGDHARR